MTAWKLVKLVGADRYTIFVSLNGTGLAIMVIFIGINTMDMMFRDDHVYDEYKHTSLPSTASSK